MDAQKEKELLRYTICPNHHYGDHIPLFCRNHPNKRWSTKNIDFIGARTLFYNLHNIPDMGPECSCSTKELRCVCRLQEPPKINLDQVIIGLQEAIGKLKAGDSKDADHQITVILEVIKSFHAGKPVRIIADETGHYGA